MKAAKKAARQSKRSRDYRQGYSSGYAAGTANGAINLVLRAEATLAELEAEHQRFLKYRTAVDERLAEIEAEIANG
jgi:flagellar biosynthesis/type III secretory pathway protein FliH